MKLPNGDRAIVEARKVYEYCLSVEHEEGKHKASLFREMLGLTADNGWRLIRALQDAAVRGEAIPGVFDRYGQRYVVDFQMEGDAKSVVVRSAWIVPTNEVAPRLVTCYIL
jgi:hypothetical protein